GNAFIGLADFTVLAAVVVEQGRDAVFKRGDVRAQAGRGRVELRKIDRIGRGNPRGTSAISAAADVPLVGGRVDRTAADGDRIGETGIRGASADGDAVGAAADRPLADGDRGGDRR